MKRILTTIFILSALLSAGQNLFRYPVVVDSAGTNGGNPSSSKVAFEVRTQGKGVLLARMNTTTRNAIANPPKGLIVDDTTAGGLWRFNGTIWLSIGGGGTGDSSCIVAITSPNSSTLIFTHADGIEDTVIYGGGGGGDSLVAGSGIHFSGDSVHAGGVVTENPTYFNYSPDTISVVFGDFPGQNYLYWGNPGTYHSHFELEGARDFSMHSSRQGTLRADTTFRISSDEVYITDTSQTFIETKRFTVYSDSADILMISHNGKTNSNISITNSDSLCDVTFIAQDDSVSQLGFYTQLNRNTKDGFSNIFWGILDNSQQITDLSRVQVMGNRADGNWRSHSVVMTDTTAVSYNGFEATRYYSQLEYHKLDEDGQATGNCLTVTDSVCFYVSGTKKFVVTSGGNVTATTVSCSPTISSGAVPPASTPTKVGDIYVDVIAKKLYFATGTGSSADWTIAN